VLRVNEIKAGDAVTGLEPTAVVTVVAVLPIGEGSVQVIYKRPDGTLGDRLIGKADEDSIGIATTDRPWSFDGDGDAFKLAVEAKRIDLAFLFDPIMAIHTSVLKRYERVCFAKEAVRPLDRPGLPFAQMIHPGHPLMLAVSDLILEQPTVSTLSANAFSRSGTRAYNELITSWTGIESAAATTPKPDEGYLPGYEQ